MSMQKPATELLQPAQHVPDGFASLSQGVFHASTIVYPDLTSFLERDVQHSYSYGQNGTPTHHALAEKVAQLEGGGATLLVPTGLAAIVLVNSCVLAAGDHVLLPDAVYGPSLAVMQNLFRKWRISCSLYAGTEDLAGLLRPETRLVWTESPGSNCLEMQDIPAIVEIAHAHGALVAMDNTWATPLGFRPLDAGVDFSVQALTKYVGGHSDLLMGAVTARDEAWIRQLRVTCEELGYYVAPDECFLALRGMATMALRLERHQATALKIAGLLASHPHVAQVMYPPLPGDAGHALWRRDYTLGGGLLSFTFKEPGLAPVERFVSRLKLFRLGNSWGAVHSLVAVAQRRMPSASGQDGVWLVRLHAGIEDPDDLLADVSDALN
jgi:cystathionine beta-lyase